MVQDTAILHPYSPFTLRNKVDTTTTTTTTSGLSTAKSYERNKSSIVINTPMLSSSKLMYGRIFGHDNLNLEPIDIKTSDYAITGWVTSPLCFSSSSDTTASKTANDSAYIWNDGVVRNKLSTISSLSNDFYSTTATTNSHTRSAGFHRSTHQNEHQWFNIKHTAPKFSSQSDADATTSSNGIIYYDSSINETSTTCLQCCFDEQVHESMKRYCY